MATYTFLLNSLAAGNEDERRYPHLTSSRHKRSLLFVVAASSLAIAASVVVAGIVGAAFLIYKYWAPIKAFFVGVGQGTVAVSNS